MQDALTAYRDYDSPASERMLPELQRSIIAYHELSRYAPFAKAKSMQELQSAIMMWQMQYQIDETTGESHLPTEKYINFALQLAAMYKGQTQRLTQSTLSRMLDLIQGKHERDLFSDNTSDNTPRTLAQAIREVLNIEYNGKTGSIVLGSDDAASPARRQGSPGSNQRDQQGTHSQQPADNTGETGVSDDERDGQGDNGDAAPRRGGLAETEEIDGNGHPFVVSSDGTYPDISIAYSLSHSLRMIFNNKKATRESGEESLARWYAKVGEFGDENFNTVAATIYERQGEILNYFINRATNASAESLNSKIKRFRAQLHGVVDVKFFLFRLSKIFG